MTMKNISTACSVRAQACCPANTASSIVSDFSTKGPLSQESGPFVENRWTFVQKFGYNCFVIRNFIQKSPLFRKKVSCLYSQFRYN